MTRLGLLWVLVSAVLTMGANLLLRAGIDRGDVGSDAAASMMQRYLVWFSQPMFLVGVVLYGLAALVWFRVVASEPLSSAYPILVGATFVLVIFGAALCFDERISLLKAIGSVVILGGIIMISRGSP